jgi:hypothetical protein
MWPRRLFEHRIHIVGVSPRTGTTLLTELMVHGFTVDAFTRHECPIFTQPDRKCRVFCSKNPSDLSFAAKALRWEKRLHVLCLVRDPRDIVVSTHRHAPDRYWANLAFYRYHSGFLEKLAGHPRFTVVRYEDLVSDPDRVQAEIARRLPFVARTSLFSRALEKARPSEDSLKALNGLRPIDQASVGAWKNHLGRLAQQIQRHGPLSDDLVRLGYEADTGWEKILEGVVPDAPNGFFRDSIFEKKSIKISWMRQWRFYRYLLGSPLRIRTLSHGLGAGPCEPRILGEGPQTFTFTDQE